MAVTVIMSIGGMRTCSIMSMVHGAVTTMTVTVSVRMIMTVVVASFYLSNVIGKHNLLIFVLQNQRGFHFGMIHGCCFFSSRVPQHLTGSNGGHW